MYHILVVEDDVTTSMDLCKRLEEIGYQISGVAISGEEAIRLTDSLQPDLILMDIMLQGNIDGTAAASIIAKTHPIPIIFVTAHHDDHSVARAKLSGPFGYLLKPIKTKELQIAIELALQHHRMNKEAAVTDKLVTVGILASSIIHEINNPLNWIFSNLSVLREGLANTIEFTTTRDLTDLGFTVNDAFDEAEKIRNIIRDLKSFNQFDEGEFLPANIHDIIDNVVNVGFASFRHIARVEKIFDPNMPLLILNSNKMHQVLLNLIVNAGQAFPASSDKNKNVITITTKFIEARLVISIQDTGVGIESGALDRIFKPFYSTKPGSIGAGLGLPICRDIVTTLGGQLTVRSEMGKGALFVVSLPAKMTLTEMDQMAHSVLVTTSKKRILLIDDDITSLVILKRIVGRDNEVVAVGSGQVALDLLKDKAYQFDAIITDLNMPDISGADLYRFLAGADSVLQEKMIFVTGGTYTKKMGLFLEELKNPCLRKPYTPIQLLDVLKFIVK